MNFITDSACLVQFLPDGGLIPNYSIEAAHIMSLEIVPAVSATIQNIAPPQATKAPAEFQDPAILSVSNLLILLINI